MPVRPPDVGDVARRLLRSSRPATPRPTPDPFLVNGRIPGIGADPSPPSGPYMGGQSPDYLNGPDAGGAGGGYDPYGDIGATVASIINPQLDYWNQRYGAQASGVRNAFGQLTNQYVSALGRYAGQVPGMFQPSERLVDKSRTGIRNELVQLGQTTGQAQSDATRFINYPKNAGAEDIKLNKIGRGSGGAAYAIGGAMLDALRAAQQHAEANAAQQPGFAQLEGTKATQSVLSQLAGELADQLAQTTAQAPQLYYQIYNDLQDRAQNDRQFAEQVREWQAGFDAQQAQTAQAAAARRAGITGPQAPTIAGRTAYWQSVAADRTNNTGVQYVGTSTGIRPVDADPTRPGIQPSYTLKGQAAQLAGIKTQAQINAENRRANIAQQNANTSARRATIAARQAQVAQQREANRHAEALARIQVAERNARTAAQRAAVARRAEAERERHNAETERIARMKKAAGGSGGGSGL